MKSASYNASPLLYPSDSTGAVLDPLLFPAHKQQFYYEREEYMNYA